MKFQLVRDGENLDLGMHDWTVQFVDHDFVREVATLSAESGRLIYCCGTEGTGIHVDPTFDVVEVQTIVTQSAIDLFLDLSERAKRYPLHASTD